jgi:hypothetical protein
MLNLAFVFDDAIRALAGHSDRLEIASLPAAVYLMQVDVINHYRYALDHYLTVPLEAPFLQNSSLGPPYQKWAYFTNEDFGMLSFAVHNLLRYTSRLVHESECISLRESGRYAERKRTSNAYTDPICEIRYRNKSIGITFHDDHRLSIIAVRTERSPERVIARSTGGGPTLFFRVTSDPDGNEQEQPIGLEEFQRVTETIRAETIDIHDRSRLRILRERGQREIAGLQERNCAFAEICNVFYQSRRVTEPFEKLNESYWT